MEPIKIFVADDHPLFLKGLRDTLIEEADFEIVGSAGNGLEALQQINSLNPGVAVLDLDMPEMNGIEVAKQLLKEENKVKILILSMHKDPDIIKASLALGVHGYVFKDDAVNDLVSAIRTVYNGETYLSSSEIRVNTDIEHVGIEQLTKMEKKILQAIAHQKTTKQIADELFISTKTVENHRTNISRKLNLKGSNSLLKFALNIKEWI